MIKLDCVEQEKFKTKLSPYIDHFKDFDISTKRYAINIGFKVGGGNLQYIKTKLNISISQIVCV